jgi:hypothetical protein
MCNCNNKIGKMKRRTGRAARANVVSLVGMGAGVAAGMVAGRMLTNNVGVLKSNPLFGAVAQLGIGVLIYDQAGNLGRNAAAGMAANAFSVLLTTLAPGVSAQLGIGAIGMTPMVGPMPLAIDRGSVTMPGFAGVGAGKVGNVNLYVR